MKSALYAAKICSYAQVSLEFAGMVRVGVEDGVWGWAGARATPLRSAAMLSGMVWYGMVWYGMVHRISQNTLQAGVT